jgi:hypothetical protein
LHDRGGGRVEKKLLGTSPTLDQLPLRVGKRKLRRMRARFMLRNLVDGSTLHSLIGKIQGKDIQ